MKKITYFKFSVPIFIVTLILIFSHSCNVIQSEIKIEDEKEIFEEKFVLANEPKDQAARQLAKTLAKAMEIPEVRQFIKSQTEGKDDGMNSVILQAVRNEPMNGSIAQARGTNTFGELLGSLNNSANGRSDSESSAESLLDSLRSLYPTLHIAIPDLEAISAAEWDGERPLKVVYSPDQPVSEIEYLDMYDAEGNHYQIDKLNDPDELVLVIGPDYHIEAIPLADIHSSNGRTESDCYSDPIFSDSQYNYYDAQSLYLCKTPGGGDTGGGTTGGTGAVLCGTPSSADGYGPECEQKVRRWTCTKREKILSFRYNHMDEFREINGWAGSIRPHTLDLAYGSVINGLEHKESRTWYPNRSELRENDLFGKNSVKTYNIKNGGTLVYWDYQVYGNKWKFYWNAEGSGNPVEISLGFSSTIKAKLSELLEVNKTRSFSVKKTLKNGSQNIDDLLVDYCDQQYEINGIHTIQGANISWNLTTE